MPEGAPIYDLMLLLSTEAPEEQRAKILSDVESAISSSGGSIERRNDWGQRALSFRINHQSTADYHLLQFFGPPALLESLSHDLKITDGVLRFRIFKVDPEAPVMVPPAVAAPSHGSRERGPQAPPRVAVPDDEPADEPAEAPEQADEPAAPAE
jgi:small subunit ribosomal protein S6